MKALVKFAPGEGNLAVMDVPEPPLKPGHVKVEIAFCGVCGTDLHVLHDTFRNYPPVILGHEFAGTVVETAADVTGVPLGTRVTVLGATAVTCGACRYCTTGNFIFCRERRGMGHGVNGAFARFVVVRPDQLYRIPDDISFDEAAISEPFAAAIQAVAEVTQVHLGDTVLISGPGPIGLLCLKLLIAQGIRCIVVGAPADTVRLEAAKCMGAAFIINAGTANVAETVREITGGVDADLAFECAGHPDSVRSCLEALRPMGRYTQVAICGREISFPIDQVLYKQLLVTGSICYTARTWELMMRIYESGRIRLGDLITAKLPLSQWEHAFDLCARKEGIKVLLYPE